MHNKIKCDKIIHSIYHTAMHSLNDADNSLFYLRRAAKTKEWLQHLFYFPVTRQLQSFA